MSKRYRPDTLPVIAGFAPDAGASALNFPVYQTSTYAQDDLNVHKGYDYSRANNPTRNALERTLAELEGGRHGLAFASGLSATEAIFQLFNPGDPIVVGRDVYAGTFRQTDAIYRRFGFTFRYANTANLAEAEAAIVPGTRLVWIETPTNPMLEVTDIAALADLAHAAGAILVVDNTLATGYIHQPLALGADVSMLSTTKYISGHSDVIGGALVLDDDELAQRLKFLQKSVGAVPGPWDCFLTLRGIKTLALRLEKHSANALAVARFLERQPQVERVIYPGLASHAQHELARRQMRLFGGMISFVLKGGGAAARQLVRDTEMFVLAEDLGGVRSLIEVPAAMTHGYLSESGQDYTIEPGLVRASVGIENPQDLIEDLAQALERLG